MCKGWVFELTDGSRRRARNAQCEADPCTGTAYPQESIWEWESYVLAYLAKRANTWEWSVIVER